MFRSFDVKTDLVNIVHSAVLDLDMVNTETYDEIMHELARTLGEDYVIKYAYSHDGTTGAGAQVYKVVKNTDTLIARGFLYYSSILGRWEFEGVAHRVSIKRTEGEAFVAALVAGMVRAYESARSL